MQFRGPVPVLVVRRGPLSMRALGALDHDPRVELYVADELTSEWLAFARRVPGIIALTDSDPFTALGYVVTAAVSCPIVVAMSRRSRNDAPELLAAGAAATVTTPITREDVERVVPVLTQHASPARIDGTLRLLLDPISRVVRYRNKVVRLSLREFALLHCLTEQGGRPVAAEAIMTYIWGGTDVADGTRKILDVYVFQLRRKLRRLGLKQPIATLRGFGYALASQDYARAEAQPEAASPWVPGTLSGS